MDNIYNDTHVFFDALYRHTPPDYRIEVWSLTTKQTIWCKDNNGAAKASSGQTNYYVSSGLSPKDFGPNRRCSHKDVIGIPGHAIDIDIAGPAHKKHGLPETIDDGMAIIDEFPIKPTIIVHSGNGLQAWWLFHEIWLFDDQNDHKLAEIQRKRFFNTFKDYAGDKTIDSVFDLSRLMRIPGTINKKQGADPVEAKIVFINDANRYSVKEIDAELLPLDDQAVNTQGGAQGKGGSNSLTELKPAKCGKLFLDPTAEPPIDKLNILFEIDPTIKLTWDNKNGKFSSASEAEFSLINQALDAKWNDQEIANLMIAFRRRNNEKPEKCFSKRRKLSYPEWVITKAKQTSWTNRAVDNIANGKPADKDSVVGNSKKNDPKKEQDIKDAIRQKLQQEILLDIVEIRKYSGENPVYEIVTSGHGNKKLPNIKHLIDQRYLRDRIAEFAGYFMPPIKASGKDARWPQVANLLLKLVVDVDMGDDATDSGEMTSWITQYLEGEDFGTIEETANNFKPFKHTDGYIYIYTKKFKSWAFTEHNYKGSTRAIAVEFKRVGLVNVKFQPTVKGKRLTRRCWKIPQNLVPFTKSTAQVVSGGQDDDLDACEAGG